MRIAPPGPESHVYSPAELNREVRIHLEGGFPRLWLRAEISNLARPASGHLYFSLKDSKAQIRCALFKGNAVGLGFQPRNGQEVLVRGRLGLYEPRGDYQLIADAMLESGEGLLQAAFEALKKKLDSEGLFSAERKRPLPAWPRGIGLVTSASGAALQDMLKVTSLRWPAARIRLHPAQVQGDAAPASLLAALAAANRDDQVDVIIIGRGGGSLEDLWAFNDESLARAIAASTKPLVSAVGHETDVTIADLVADLRAPTPSAAAAAVTPDGPALSARLASSDQRLARAVQRINDMASQGLDGLDRRLAAANPLRRLDDLAERRGRLHARLVRATERGVEKNRQITRQLAARLHARRPDRQIARLDQQLIAIRARLDQGIGRQLKQAENRLAGQVRALNHLSPLTVLERGYGVVRDAEGTALTEPDDFQVGRRVSILMHQFDVQAEITDAPTPHSLQKS